MVRKYTAKIKNANQSLDDDIYKIIKEYINIKETFNIIDRTSHSTSNRDIVTTINTLQMLIDIYEEKIINIFKNLKVIGFSDKCKFKDKLVITLRHKNYLKYNDINDYDYVFVKSPNSCFIGYVINITYRKINDIPLYILKKEFEYKGIEIVSKEHFLHEFNKNFNKTKITIDSEVTIIIVEKIFDIEDIYEYLSENMKKEIDTKLKSGKNVRKKIYETTSNSYKEIKEGGDISTTPLGWKYICENRKR